MATTTAQQHGKSKIRQALAGIRKSPKVTAPLIVQDDRGAYWVQLTGYVSVETLTSHFYDAGFIVLTLGMDPEIGHYVKVREK